MTGLIRTSPPATGRGALALTPWSAADADELGAYWLRNRAHLTPTQPLRPDGFWTTAGQRQRLESATADMAAGRMAAFLVREGGHVVGEAILSDVSHGPFCSARLGYSVDGSRLRLGIASWAVDAVATLAFADLGLHRVQAATLLDNLASQAVLRRCGFTPIGVATGYLAIGGEWRDHSLWQRVNPSMAPPSA